MSTTPPPRAIKLTQAMRLTMGALLVYGLAKIATVGLTLQIPVLRTTPDPVFAALVIVLGVLWTWTSIIYIKESKRSKARSGLYSEFFDHPDDAFEEGKQVSKQHLRRGLLLASMGSVVTLLGASYLFFAILG